MTGTTEKSQGNFLARLVRRQIFIPLAALLLLIVFNLIADPSFFAITLKENSLGDLVLTGNLITILDNASELVILAIGMTLVTAASGGQDISVGSAIAIAGSVVLRVLCGTNSRPDTLQAPIIAAFLVCCVVSMLFGAFNGTLVAVFKIQPMVATLILYTAGRSIAAWINNNELPMISDPAFAYYGNFLPGVAVPTPIFIAVICMVLAWALLRFTNIGLYSQAVGINASAARLNGIHPQFVKFLTYVILGLCVAVAGFIKVSRFSTINYSVVAKDIEMDAILAVALGGNTLSCGMSLVMITGGIDISVGTLTALVCMSCAVNLDYQGGTVLTAILLALGIGTAFGLVQGFLIAYLEIQPFIVTLAGMFFAKGMTTIVNATQFNVENAAFKALKETRIYVPGMGSVNKLGAYVPAYVEIGVVVALVVVAVLFVVLRWTKFGRSVYAVGGNSYSANMLAINVKRTKFLAHLICGILAGIGGFVYFLHVGSGSPSHASGAEMNAIASSIIGGTMLTGGVGNIIGTLFGVLSLSTIKNIVSSLGLDEAWWTNITVAAMICLFLVIQSLVLSRKNKDE